MSDKNSENLDYQVNFTDGGVSQLAKIKEPQGGAFYGHICCIGTIYIAALVWCIIDFDSYNNKKCTISYLGLVRLLCWTFGSAASALSTRQYTYHCAYTIIGGIAANLNVVFVVQYFINASDDDCGAATYIWVVDGIFVGIGLIVVSCFLFGMISCCVKFFWGKAEVTDIDEKTNYEVDLQIQD